VDLHRISACTYPVRERDLDYTFGLLATVGFRCVDLWGGPPNYDNDAAICDPQTLRQRATRYGLRLANLGTYAGRGLLQAGAEAEMRQMRGAIDQAAAVGARSIRVCPGHAEDETLIEPLIPFMKASAAYAAQRQVRLGMENHSGSLAGVPELCRRLVQAVDSPWFGVLYEPANLLAAGVDYRQAYELFRGHVVHCHVKDGRWVDGRFIGTMLGAGDVDLAWLVRTLEADGYEGHYALEYEIERIVPIEAGLPAWLARFQAV
jgi:sugar phosphate isomerase/epimerase